MNNWLNQLNQLKEGVANKAAEAAKYVESVKEAQRKKQMMQQQEQEEESDDYYDEEQEEEKEDEQDEDYIPIRKQAIEMRLIIKQAKVTVLDPERKVRVELTRNGKKLSTDFKPVEEETGLANIKQSFNQKIQESYDNESRHWIADVIELGVYYGDDLVGSCSFDLTRYIDQGGKNEKASMISAQS